MSLQAEIKKSCKSVEEQSAVMRAYRKLVDTYLDSAHRRRVERIERAMHLALTAHCGMRRRSGEPYIMHPLAVAQIVASDLGLGSTSICAALLHDVMEHADLTRKDIEYACGSKVADIVDAITRISGGVLLGNNISETEEYRSLLLSMSADVRVIIVKMAERLHNLRTLQWIPEKKQLKVARETLFVYSPLAERLGLFDLKQKLEDLSFAYLYPKENKLIRQELSKTEKVRSSLVAAFLEPVCKKLDEAGISYHTKARVKSAYSIFNKMRKKGIPLEEIYDIYAVRIIFEDPERTSESEKRLCWEIYNCFTDFYSIHPERIRDWTSDGKSNGYRALHLTCMGPDGEWIEVQIRSRRMDDLAELGCAAHWKYKTHDNSVPELEEWMDTIRRVLSHPDSDGMDTLDEIRLGLKAHEIFVFTHKGELMRLPSSATVATMAAALNLTGRCIGAKVNHKLVDTSCCLESGDRVELIILTDDEI